MAALDALFKRLEVNTIPRQTEDAVVIHQGSGPVIMSLNQSFQNINNSADRMNATFGRMNATLDRINATLDRIEASLDSCLRMTKELLRIVKMPGFLEAFNAKKQAQIENVEVNIFNRRRP